MPEHDETGGPSAIPDNTALTAAIRAYDDGPERDRNTVLRLLLNACLWVPMAKTPAPDSSVFDVACPLIDREGKRIFAAFTDPAALKLMELPPGVVLYTVSSSTAFQILLLNDCAGLIINPKGPARFAVRRDEAEALGKGDLPEHPERVQVPAGTLIKVDQYSDRPPDKVLDELRLILELAGVETAYWCGMALDKGPLKPAILIEPHTDQITDKVMPQLEAVYSQYKPLDSQFTLMALQSSLRPLRQEAGSEAISLRDSLEKQGNWSLLFKSGHQGYPRFVRLEDTVDGWHSFHPDPRLLPAPEPPSNAALALALEEGCKNQPDDHTPIHRALLGTRLLVPVFPPPEGVRSATCMPLACRISDGSPYLVGAPNETAFRRWYAVAEMWWVVLPAERLCAMALEGRYQGVLFMSENYPGYAMALMECDAIARGELPSGNGNVQVAAGEQMAFGMPKQRPPAAFLEGLRRAADRGGADEAYWVYLTIEKQPVHMAIAVRPVARELMETLGDAIRSLINTYPGVTPYVDILDLDRQPAAREVGELLYLRKKRFGFGRLR